MEWRGVTYAFLKNPLLSGGHLKLKKKKREMTAVKEVLMTSLFLSFNFYAKEKIMILKAQTAVLFVHAQHTKKELVTDSGG